MNKRQWKVGKRIASLAILAALVGGAQAAEYSVGIVPPASTGPASTRSGGVNLYTTSNKGIKLVKGSPFVFHPTPIPGTQVSANPTTPIVGIVSEDGQFVYVAYNMNLAQPILVQFVITPNGLRYRWERQIETGGVYLDGTSFSETGGYILEKTYPSGLYIHVTNSAGQELVREGGVVFQPNGMYQRALNSSHTDTAGKFYYSCRSTTPDPNYDFNAQADTVALYDLDSITAETSTPTFFSTDPVYVKGACPVPPQPPTYGY